MGRLRWGQMAKRTAALGCAVLLACALGGCRPTDFFTEVVISPFAEEVDWDNSDKTVVNSPDAQEESADLSALDWDDESNRSEEVQNLVVYSSNPTTTLTAHHSIYDERPLFSGIEASDGVRLEFAAEAALDEETVSPEDREEPQDAEAESTGENPRMPRRRRPPKPRPANSRMTRAPRPTYRLRRAKRTRIVKAEPIPMKAMIPETETARIIAGMPTPTEAGAARATTIMAPPTMIRAETTAPYANTIPLIGSPNPSMPIRWPSWGRRLPCSCRPSAAKAPFAP